MSDCRHNLASFGSRIMSRHTEKDAASQGCLSQVFAHLLASCACPLQQIVASLPMGVREALYRALDKRGQCHLPQAGWLFFYL